jgi:F-type H+-transporting ATPase subunit b
MANEMEHAAPAGEAHATTEAHGGSHDVAPSVFGMDSTGWVSLAMAIFIAVLIFKKVPALIAKGLDSKIAAIRSQLDEAAKLRAEAEALKAEYEKKLKSADRDIANMHSRAEEEAAIVLADAKAAAAELVKRRQKMAEQKIAAAERSAIADIRAKAVNTATIAAEALIADAHNAKADKSLVDGAISSLSSVN